MVNISRLESKEFNQLILEKETVLIDIRTPDEKVMYGYIPNTNLFLDIYSSTFADELGKLDKKTKYLIYCFHGNRTSYLLNFMSENGFTDVYDLIGGIDSWAKKGFELIKDK